MQQIDHWPDQTELPLPEPASRDLSLQLLKPFNSKEEAIEFWQEAPSTIIILDPTDTIQSLQHDPVWSQIDFALSYPEYTVTLTLGYLLFVAIVNDSGGGIYLVIPPELSDIIHREKP